MRLFAFIVACLLLGGNIDRERGWWITLTVVTGVAAMRPRFWNWLQLRPAIDLRMAAFVLSILFLAGTIDPTKDWLIAYTVVTGVAMIAPNVFAIDPFGFNHRAERAWDWDWQIRVGDKWARRQRRWERKWDRWERKMDDRHTGRHHGAELEDDWS